MSEQYVLNLDTPRAAIAVYEKDETGRLTVALVDDVVSITKWGDGYIVRMETRDPVIVRRDGLCTMLVTEGR